MSTLRRSAVTVAAMLAAGCSDSASAPSVTNHGGDASSMPDVVEAGAGQTSEHGTLYDYGSLLGGQFVPVHSLTITDGTQTATSDADGKFALVEPTGVALNATISGSSSGDTYPKLFLPEVIFNGPDGDRGDAILADDSTFSLERTLLTPDASMALVQLLVLPTGSCKSAEGGRVVVDSPAGVKVRYMDSIGYPRATQTAIASFPQLWRAAAVLYNVDPAATLTVHVTHPTCKQIPFPATYKSTTFTGKVVMQPLSANVASALVVLLEGGDGSDAGADDAGADGAGANDAGANEAGANDAGTNDAATD
jgi:hypothetical protein